MATTKMVLVAVSLGANLATRVKQTLPNFFFPKGGKGPKVYDFSASENEGEGYSKTNFEDDVANYTDYAGFAKPIYANTQFGHCKVNTGCFPQQPILPMLTSDCNPIGTGNIHGAYGLLVNIFGTPSGGSGKLNVNDLKRILLQRRFPKDFVCPSCVMRALSARQGGAPRVGRRTITTTQVAEEFVLAKKQNIGRIICPFLSTLVNEGVLAMQQSYSRQLLESVTIETGLDPESAAEHTQDNFLNVGNGIDVGERDIFNMEGVTNEHLSSTGINDCTTVREECRDKTNSFQLFSGGASRPNERCSTVRYTCDIPNEDIFNMFVDAVDTNNDNAITTTELDDAARRTCIFGKASAR